VLLLDHVILAVRDLDEAADRLYDEHGLASVFGGHHDGLGTANRIVPLGETYIELMSVTDHGVATSNVFGRTLLSFLDGGDRLMAWAVATDEIDHVAKWIGSTVMPSARMRPDGVVLEWRMTGVEGALADRSLPFFIQWDCPLDAHPGRARVEHATPVKGLVSLEIAGKATKIRNRVNGEELPIRVTAGEPPGPVSVTIATSDGEVVLT
jgi:glyoxalase-like protein